MGQEETVEELLRAVEHAGGPSGRALYDKVKSRRG